MTCPLTPRTPMWTLFSIEINKEEYLMEKGDDGAKDHGGLGRGRESF